MSPELSAATNANQLNASPDSNIGNSQEYVSPLTPIAVLRARQAIAAAVATAPSGSLEVAKIDIEKTSPTPQQEMRISGLRLKSFRQAYDDDNFSLTEEEIRQDMFDLAA